MTLNYDNVLFTSVKTRSNFDALYHGKGFQPPPIQIAAIVARTLSELVRVTPSSSTFNATLYQNAPSESRNKSRDQSTAAFLHVNKQNGGDC